MNKRVLFVTNSGGLGGASRDLLSLLGRLRTSRIEPVVVVAEPGPFGAEVEALGIKTVRVAQPWWVTSGSVDAWLYSIRLLPKAVESLRSVICKEDIAAVVTNVAVVPAGALAASMEGKPHAWIVREFMGHGGFLGPLDPATIYGCMGALSTRVVCVSNTLAASVRRTTGQEKVAVVYSGVDTARFADCAPDYDSRVIVSVGTTTPEKGLDDLVEAAGILAGKTPKFTVRIVGEFDHLTYKAKIERRLKSLGIQNCFQFSGFQKDTRPCLRRAAICCNPSHTEGMGMTIVEAMAAGLPVVATDCGGPRDLVEDGKTGVLVPVKNPETLAGALEQMLADPGRRKVMGEAGRRRALELFDLKTTLPQLAGILEEVIQSSPAAQSKPLAELMMKLLEVGGPRILMGKKWKLLQLMGKADRP